MVTQPVEKLWRTRNFPGSEDIKWTYVGLRSGVFRTFPGHRSRRGYDPTGCVKFALLCFYILALGINLYSFISFGYHIIEKSKLLFSDMCV